MMVAHSPVKFRERAHEWLSAWVVTWAGIIFLLPGDAFNRPFYTTLANIMSEDAWGVACFTVGLTRLLVLTINGLWLPSYRLRAGTAFVSLFFWVQITLGLLWNQPVGLGLAVFPAFILGDIYAVYRSIIDYRVGNAIQEAYENEPGSK